MVLVGVEGSRKGVMETCRRPLACRRAPADGNACTTILITRFYASLWLLRYRCMEQLIMKTICSKRRVKRFELTWRCRPEQTVLLLLHIGSKYHSIADDDRSPTVLATRRRDPYRQGPYYMYSSLLRTPVPTYLWFGAVPLTLPARHVPRLALASCGAQYSCSWELSHVLSSWYTAMSWTTSTICRT